MQEREAMAVLCAVKALSYGRRELALRAAGSAGAILAEPGAYALELGEAGLHALRAFLKEGGDERLTAYLARRGVKLLARGEAGYGERLMQIPNPPHLLFICGSTRLDDERAVGVVGTRKASPYGLRNAQRIAREMAQQGVCVVSGLAMGIDSAGHRGALEAGGRTIAVLGGALDQFYPADNRGLAREIVAGGGSVITEYPPGFAPTKYTFLHRNRIIAGLGQGLLVVEGGRRSGALRTAQDALDYGREVFAVPGSVESTGSQLPHLLIAEGARLVTCGQDVLEALAFPGKKGEPQREGQEAAPRRKRRENAPARKTESAGGDAQKTAAKPSGVIPEGLSEQEAAVYRALLEGEMDFDALCERTGVPSDDLGALLMMMDMDGWVRALPGTRYALSGREE